MSIRTCWEKLLNRLIKISSPVLYDLYGTQKLDRQKCMTLMCNISDSNALVISLKSKKTKSEQNVRPTRSVMFFVGSLSSIILKPY